MKRLLVLSLIVLVGCERQSRSPVVTLYRNSDLDPSLRILWSTFDANESDAAYNTNNCAMAARLLNANVKKLNGEKQSAGFWCEPGRYREKGTTPSSFPAAFPTE